MAHSVTRCPHCKTSFRIHDKQLTAAHGAVRCGSCLEIFTAKDHLVTQAGSIPKSTPKQPVSRSVPDNPISHNTEVTASPQTQQSPSDSLEDQQEVDANELFDNMFGNAEDDDGSNDDPFVFSDTTSSANTSPGNSDWGDEVSDFGDLLDDSLMGNSESNAAPSIPATPQPPEYEDEAIHDDMDDDDDFLIHDDMDDDEEEMISDDPFADLGLREPDDLARPEPMAGLEIDESLLDAVQAEDEETLMPDAHDDAGDDDEAWAKALLEDDEPPEDITRELGLDLEPAQDNSSSRTIESNSSIQPAGQSTASRETSSASASPIRPRKPSVEFELAEDDPVSEPSTPATSTRTIEIPTRAMREIQPEPIKLESTEKKPEVNKDYLGWVTGSVTLLLLAALQLFYFNFDQWARTPQWRPVYASLCSVTGCDLPAVQDIRRIKARNLVVRSHPTVTSALVVDTLMQNDAAFPQPFPDLVLIFRDLNDNIVASRQFSPLEYLSGEMSGSQDMPSRTPIHVGIEILDPGQNAVSYAVQLAPNQ